MPARVFVIHGSHPGATVLKGFEIKGIKPQVIELPPLLSRPIMKRLFGEPTTPAVRWEDGEKTQGSVQILAKLDEKFPEPTLLPTHPALRQRVLESEAWASVALQPVARRIVWAALQAAPDAAPSFVKGSKPPVPGAVAKKLMPFLAGQERRIHEATPDQVAADLEELPSVLGGIDNMVTSNIIGQEQPNRADLQIASSVRLLLQIEDLKPHIIDRPSGQLAMKLFPDVPGVIPAGTIEVPPIFELLKKMQAEQAAAKAGTA